jgi:hypothetical protein
MLRPNETISTISRLRIMPSPSNSSRNWRVKIEHRHLSRHFRARLLEQSETDPASGQFVSRNYSGYLVATNADIPELDVLFVGGFDEEASPLGAKGLGELTAVSVAPAIANAVYHATGKRVRDLPITIEKLL